jgi:hypothetical protein
MVGKNSQRVGAVVEPLERRALMSVSLAGAPTLQVNSTETVVAEDTLSRKNRQDYYKFSVQIAGDLTVKLEGLTNNSMLELFHDRNANNRIDPGELVMRSNKPGIQSEVVSKLVNPGPYAIRVTMLAGLQPTSYQLKASTTPYTQLATRDLTGNDLSEARNVTVPTRGSTALNESIGGSDLVDVYRWNIVTRSKVTIRLNGLVFNANIEIIQDKDQDGEIDPDEIIASTHSKAISNKVLTGALQPGTYYIRVTPAAALPTGYALRLVSDWARSTDRPLKA